MERAPEEARGGNSSYTAGTIRFAYDSQEEIYKLVPDLTAEEKANTATIATFFKSWGGIAPDAMKLTAPIADECYVTVNPGPPAPLTTRAALAEAFKVFLTDGQSFEIQILESVALGPSVYVTRMDYILKNGKRVPEDKGTPAVGLFVFKDGKIKYWHDYAFTPA